MPASDEFEPTSSAGRRVGCWCSAAAAVSATVLLAALFRPQPASRLTTDASQSAGVEYSDTVVLSGLDGLTVERLAVGEPWRGHAGTVWQVMTDAPCPGRSGL